MHFMAFVVTQEKPTEVVLAAALDSFGHSEKGGEDHWDYYCLGGRYARRLIPYGGAEMSETERRFVEFLSEAMDLTLTRPGPEPSPGVDALQICNLQELQHGTVPYVLIVGDCWHECPVFPGALCHANRMARGWLVG